MPTAPSPDKAAPSSAVKLKGRPERAALDRAYRVSAPQKFALSQHDPADQRFFPDKDAARASAGEDAEAIDQLQDRLFAEGKRALLVVLQGMDTSGKDGTVRGVFNACGPLGVRVTGFGRPSEEELAHDFLWRVHRVVPGKGMIGVFNRSHYEDVLVVKVRNLVPAEVVEARYEQINAFEKMLVQTGTTILKFKLHISQVEQGERLRERLIQPDKRWKFNPGDLEDRKLWASYTDAYQTAIARCSTPHAPWYVIPADSKTRRNAIIARIVRTTLEAMNPVPRDPGYRPEQFAIV
jgi:PPK2 family polyphosphate:nucleotide phosphotransferase